MVNPPTDLTNRDIKTILDSFTEYPKIEENGRIIYARMTNPKFLERSDPRVGILLEFSGGVSDIRNLHDILTALNLDDYETKLLYPCCGQDMAPFNVLGNKAYYTDKDKLTIEMLKKKLGVNAEKIHNKDLPVYAKKIEPNILYLKNPADMGVRTIGSIPVDYVVSDLSVVTEFSDREIEEHLGTLIFTVSQEDAIDDVTVGIQRDNIFSATRQFSSERPKMFVFQK